MSYAEFLLKSSPSVVEFETIQISHPNFTRTYWLVANNVDGLSAVLEDGNEQVFEFCPLEISPSNSTSDLDFMLGISFGDLGEILPTEIDNVRQSDNQQVIEPVVFNDNLFNIDDPNIVTGSFINQTNGAVNNLAGHNSTHFIPVTAGLDYYMSSVHRLAWYDSAQGFISGLISSNSSSPEQLVAPANAAFVRFSVVDINLPQLVVAQSSSFVPFQPFGLPEPPTQRLTSGFQTKPVLTYRSYRSDNLEQPMVGPIKLTIENIVFNRVGCSFEASATPSNRRRIGYFYRASNFPTLVNF